MDSKSSSSSSSATMAGNRSGSSSSSAHNSNSSHKRVRFDERCRVRSIKKLCYVEQQVRDLMWYNREELKNIRKDCRDLMREALHQLQKAHVKQKKKEAQENLQEMGQESHPCSPHSLKKKNKAKHLFPPSAFRGLEMFHPKMSFKREGRRQELWEAILTKQVQQEMKRQEDDENENESTTSKDDSKTKKKKRLPKEQDLQVLAKLSLTMTEIASKEAHKRALRDQQDLLHPPKYWMLPWLREDGTPKTPSSSRSKTKRSKKDTPILPIAPPLTIQVVGTDSPKTSKCGLTTTLEGAKLRELLHLKQDQPPPPLTSSLSSLERSSELRV